MRVPRFSCIVWGGGSTGGCVAIPQSDLLTVIRRLHRNAKIVIGTAADIATY